MSVTAPAIDGVDRRSRIAATHVLKHLTMGRAALFAAILSESEISDLKFEIDCVVSST